MNADLYNNYEVDRLMKSVGMEAFYAKDKVFRLHYGDDKYGVMLIDHAAKVSVDKTFDDSDEAKAEFKRLAVVNPNRDYDADFNKFMNAVEDNKRFHRIS